MNIYLLIIALKTNFYWLFRGFFAELKTNIFAKIRTKILFSQIYIFFISLYLHRNTCPKVIFVCEKKIVFPFWLLTTFLDAKSEDGFPNVLARLRHDVRGENFSRAADSHRQFFFIWNKRSSNTVWNDTEIKQLQRMYNFVHNFA